MFSFILCVKHKKSGKNSAAFIISVKFIFLLLLSTQFIPDFDSVIVDICIIL